MAATVVVVPNPAAVLWLAPVVQAAPEVPGRARAATARRARPVRCWAAAAVLVVPVAMRSPVPGKPVASVDRAVIDLLEAAELASQIGAEFSAVVLSHGRDGLRVQVTDPPVIADAIGEANDGDTVRVRLSDADPMKRLTRFKVVPQPAD